MLALLTTLTHYFLSFYQFYRIFFSSFSQKRDICKTKFLLCQYVDYIFSVAFYYTQNKDEVISMIECHDGAHLCFSLSPHIWPSFSYEDLHNDSLSLHMLAPSSLAFHTLAFGLHITLLWKPSRKM